MPATTIALLCNSPAGRLQWASALPPQVLADEERGACSARPRTAPCWASPQGRRSSISQRTLTAPIVQALLDPELFYLMVPAALGGLEVDGRT